MRNLVVIENKEYEDTVAVTDSKLHVLTTALGATTPTIYNLTVVAGDTEYSQALPDNTSRFSLQCLTDYDMRFAFVTGKVAVPTAPYALVRAGMNYYEDEVNLSSVTLYVASDTAGVVAEIIAWS